MVIIYLGLGWLLYVPSLFDEADIGRKFEGFQVLSLTYDSFT